MTTPRTLIIGTDGLRPDMVAADVMPTVACLMARGTRFRQYVAAYPSETRVSMSTLTTGVYPGKHGVMGNRMMVRGFGEEGILETGDHRDLMAYRQQVGHPLLLRPTLGDRLHARNLQLGVATSSSPGAALLWNLNHPRQVINASTSYDEPTLEAVHARLGEPAPESPGTLRNRADWAVRALINEHLANDRNRIMVLWLSEPDKSLHNFSPGAPEVQETLRVVDGHIATVLQAVEELGLAETLNVLLISDHGHSTVDFAGPLQAHVDEAARMLDLRFPLQVVGNHLYAIQDAPISTAAAHRLVTWLCRQPWCDLVFTSQQDLTALPGVLSLECIYGPIEHDRAPLFVVNPRWTDEENRFGARGTTCGLKGSRRNISAHGTLSPYDLHAFCLGVGPAFLEGAISDIPCGLVDIAPTACRLSGLEDEEGFDGRVLTEGLKHPATCRSRRVVHQLELPESDVSGQGLRVSVVDDTRYLRGTGTHTPASASDDFMTIAHRGASSYAPENTLAAFDIALAMGVPDIELDVHLTRDGEVVVLHDDTVDRTTNGSGPVEDFRFTELQKLGAGHSFSPAYADERIPTLDAVLDRYGATLRIPLPCTRSLASPHFSPDGEKCAPPGPPRESRVPRLNAVTR